MKFMNRSVTSGSLLLLGATLGITLWGCSQPAQESLDRAEAKNVETLTVTSPAFEPDGVVPVEYTCRGKGISPPLAWEGAPNETVSFAVIVENPNVKVQYNAGDPYEPFTHWIVYNVPTEVNELQAAIPADVTSGQGPKQGKDDYLDIGYQGICSEGRRIEPYVFKVYALDRTLPLEAGATRHQVMEAMTGHVLAEGKLVGNYSPE